MKLINVTNDHSRLVYSQLENTDAQLVEVYSAGNTSIIYTEAPHHNEIVMVNKTRNIRNNEIDAVKKFFLKKMPAHDYDPENIKTIKMEGLVEISVPKD
jgi:hypothetical protein